MTRVVRVRVVPTEVSVKSITFLSKADQRETASKWEESARGIIIPTGAASEVLIPWHRVLEIWDDRGKIPRD
jgi:uncharacterized protein (UPF0248 family)